MPGGLILPRPQYYLLGFICCHIITSLWPILPFFFFVFNFLKIFLECQLWQKWSLLPPILFRSHMEPKICNVCSSAYLGDGEQLFILVKGREKGEVQVLALFSIIYIVFVCLFCLLLGLFTFQAFSLF